MADADPDARSRWHATADSSTAAAHSMPPGSTSIALVESWAFLLSGRISYYEWPSPTLAELLMPLPAANPFSTMRASLRWYSSEELEDGVTYGGQRWLRRGGGGFFFFPAFVGGGGGAGRGKGAISLADGGGGRVTTGPPKESKTRLSFFLVWS